MVCRDPVDCRYIFLLFYLKFFIMPWNAIAGLFGLGGNIFQASQANKWNQKLLDAQIAENQKNRDFNKSEAEIARNFQADFAREMFDKTNKYNSISNQVAQLREAGLNPALAYSGNSFAPGSMPNVSPTSATTSGGLSTSQYATTDMVGPALAIARQQAEIDNIEADTRQKSAQSSILESDASFRDAWNAGLLDLQGVQVNLGESQKKVNDEQASKLRVDAQYVQKQIDALNKQIQLFDVQIESGNLDNIGKRIDNYFKTPQYEALIDNIKAQTGKSKAEITAILSKLPSEIAELRSRSNLNNASAALAGQKSISEIASRALLYKVGELYDLQVDYQLMNNELTSIDLSNARDVRSTRSSLGPLGQALWTTKDLISGIMSAPVSFGKSGGGITINNN